MKINKLIDLNKVKFDKFYNKILQKKLDKSLLAKAMKYSSINGGKRIRSFLEKNLKILKKIPLLSLSWQFLKEDKN